MPTPKRRHFPSPLRYSGGKGNLLDQILPRLGPFRDYVEPFVGGGAVFWALLGEGKLNGQRAILAEMNPAVFDFYKRLTDPTGWRELTAQLNGWVDLKTTDPEQFYYYQRQQLNIAIKRSEGGRTAGLSDLGLSAGPHFYVCNRTGMNGLVRMNLDNEFNVPVGRDNDKKPLRFTHDDVDALVEAHYLCRRARITVSDLAGHDLILRAPVESTVYVDPPYTGGFVSYTRLGWTADDDEVVYKACAKARAKRGCRVVLSQPDNEHVRSFLDKFLKGWEVVEVAARRSGNSDGDGRKSVGELLIVGRP